MTFAREYFKYTQRGCKTLYETPKSIKHYTQGLNSHVGYDYHVERIQYMSKNKNKTIIVVGQF